jgi:hypothetical protein
MAQRRKARRKAKQQARPRREGTVLLESRNVLLLVAGIIVITLGYMLLGRGSITAAPILLVIGYCVIVPLSIILWVKRPASKQESKLGE